MPRMNKYKANKNKDPFGSTNIIATNSSKISERTVGAASVGVNARVTDTVVPVQTNTNSIGIPEVSAAVVEPLDSDNFELSIVTNKQDRLIDVTDVKGILDATSAGVGNETNVGINALNNVSVASIETNIAIRPTCYGEVTGLTPVGKLTKGTNKRNALNALLGVANRLCRAPGKEGVTIRQFNPGSFYLTIEANPPVQNFSEASGRFGFVLGGYSLAQLGLTATHKANIHDSNPSYNGTVYFTSNGDNLKDVLPKLIAKAAAYPTKFAESTFYLGDGEYFPCIVDENANGEAVILLVTSATAVVGQSTDVFNWYHYSKTLLNDSHIVLEPLVGTNYEVTDNMREADKFVSELANMTPGLCKYSNADIAIALLAVTFKKMAVSRNDTINPCYQLRLSELNALIKRNIMMAANAQIAVNQLFQLKQFAALVNDNMWKAWANTAGIVVKNRIEEIDAAIAALQGPLAGVRVHKELMMDLVHAHSASLVPLRTEGTMKAVIYRNACFPASYILPYMIAGVQHANMVDDENFTSTYKQDASYSDYNAVLSNLLDYSHSLVSKISDKWTATIDSGTACYSLLEDVGVLEPDQLGIMSKNFMRYNAGRRFSIQMEAGVVTVNRSTKEVNDYRAYSMSPSISGAPGSSYDMHKAEEWAGIFSAYSYKYRGGEVTLQDKYAERLSNMDVNTAKITMAQVTRANFTANKITQSVGGVTNWMNCDHNVTVITHNSTDLRPDADPFEAYYADISYANWFDSEYDLDQSGCYDVINISTAQQIVLSQFCLNDITLITANPIIRMMFTGDTGTLVKYDRQWTCLKIMLSAFGLQDTSKFAGFPMVAKSFEQLYSRAYLYGFTRGYQCAEGTDVTVNLQFSAHGKMKYII